MRAVHLACIGLLAMAFASRAIAEVDPYAPAVARTVRSFIEFTRWPTHNDPMRLCVAGGVLHDERLDGLRLSDGRLVQRRSITTTAAAATGCDVLYLGQMSPAAMKQIIAAVRGRNTLTIAESDPTCRSEAMFCLLYQPRSLSFRLNLDAISRSGLKVDPRVLRLAEGGL